MNGKRVPTTDRLFWAGCPGVVFLPPTAAPTGRSPRRRAHREPAVRDRCIAFARLPEREFQGCVQPSGSTQASRSAPAIRRCAFGLSA